MPDYNSLIDAETWTFIKRTTDAMPDDAVQGSTDDLRAAYDTMCAVFHQSHPKGITVHDAPVAGVACRHYMPDRLTHPDKQIVYFHGGGFVVGGLESHDDVCAELCAATGTSLVAVDYRLAPEHKHPAAFDDAMAVVKAVAKDGGPVLLCGDSAGANLAAAVAHRARSIDAMTVCGQVLIYPALGGDMSKGSYREHAHAPMLTLSDIQAYMGARVSDRAPTSDPSYAPLHDSDFSNLAPTFIVTADCDPIRDDGRDYAEAIVAAGGNATCVNEPGLVHGYLRARHSVERARQSFSRICAAATSFLV